MNKVLISLKKFITNKNTVTILGVIAILVLLYVGYTFTINTQVEPIRVPVATSTIQPKTEITDEMFEMIEVPKVSVSNNVIRAESLLIGKFSNINTVIPAGSMFYTDTVVDESQIPGTDFSRLGEGERPYTLEVTFKDSYYNALKPGDVIDIYMSAFDEFDKYLVGRLFQQVEILAVKDSSGQDVFENSEENRTTSSLLIAVPENYFIILKKAEYLESVGVDLFPVPYGVQPEADINVDQDTLLNIIEAQTQVLPGQEIVEQGTVPEPTPAPQTTPEVSQ